MFENGAGVQMSWRDGTARISYLGEDGRTNIHICDAQVHVVSSPPQSDEIQGLPAGVVTRAGAPGEPVLLTVENHSAQAVNGKSTLAIFPDGTVVNYPVDAFVDASFGTSKAGKTWMLGACFQKAKGTKVFLSPEPAPLRESGAMPNIVFVAIRGTRVVDHPSLVDWNSATVVPTDTKETMFDLRTGARGANAQPGVNAVELSVFREAREAKTQKAVAIAGGPALVPQPSVLVSKPPPPVVDAKRGRSTEFKDGRIVFKTAAGQERVVEADYARAIKNSEQGYLSSSATVEHGKEKYTVLKIFNTAEGNGPGELFVIRESDAKIIRFGFKSENLKPLVEDGILSVAGTERRIDLERFDREASRQSRRPAQLKDPMNVAIDPIADVKALFRDYTADFRQTVQAQEMLKHQTTFVNEQLRPAAAQDGGGSIVIHGVPGTGAHDAVEGFVDAYVHGQYPEIPRTWPALQLDVGALGTGTGLVGATATREQAMAEYSREIPCFWIAPDFAALKNVGSSSGDSSGSISRLAPHIEKGTMQLIALTSTAGYAESVANDPRMRTLFQPAELKEAPTAEIVESLATWMRKHEKQLPDEESEAYKTLQNVLGEVVSISSEFDAVNGQPHKAIRLLKIIFAQKRVKGESDVLSRADIERAAVSLYNVDKSLFDPKLLAEKLQTLKARLDDELVGINYAKKVVVQGYANVFTRMTPSRTPRNKTLFAGPPGTGKSATAEISAKHVGLPIAVLEMNNYVTQDSLEQFLFDVATALRSNGYSTLIFDEFEKAHDVVKSAALRMMQNGEFSARDSMEGKTSSRSTVQTTNTSFLLTTNAAEDYVMDCYLGVQTFTDAGFRAALLAGGIPRALLDRIDEAVPVAPFKKKTFRAALERAIDRFEKGYATSMGKVAPLKLENKQKFIDDLVAANFEGDTELPLDIAGTNKKKLINGRLVNRLIKRYLADPVSYDRALFPERNCVDIVLKAVPESEANMLD